MSKVDWDKAPDGTERYREQGIRPWLRKVDGRVEYYDTDTERWVIYLHNHVGIEHWRDAIRRPSRFDVDAHVSDVNERSEESTAVKTLKSLGYSWNGGEQWKPPIGKSPEYINVSDVDRVGVMSDGKEVALVAANDSYHVSTDTKRYYIAGPITGHGSTYRDVFNAVSDTLSAQGHVVLNPATLPAGLTQGQYMDICTAMLRCVTHVKMLKGWERSEGARIEHALAIKSDLTVEYE
jgi:hypothetical protein